MHRSHSPCSRREILAALAACGGSALLLSGRALPQASNPRRLDLHQHHFSPAWLQMLERENAIRPVQGFEVMKAYSPSRSLEAMDEGGVATAFLSTPTPGTWFGNPDETRRVARAQNEYGARLAADHPGRFGLFATLPLPDIDASLREIEYAADSLQADGFGLITSYNDVLGGTRWLGDAAFGPIWEELDRRGAVVYTHASTPGCCSGDFQPDAGGPIVLEFSTDLARAIISIIESGTANRTPNVTYVWSHGGGTIFASRYLGRDASAAALAGIPAPDSKLHHLRRFYYDTASAADAVHLALLTLVVSSSQIVFGTDLPWGSPARIAADLASAGFAAKELEAIERSNALRFLPAYA